MAETRLTITEWAKALARTLAPSPLPQGLEQTICVQILVDALSSFPTPQTLAELQRALDEIHPLHIAGTGEFFRNLRRRATESPTQTLASLVQ